MMKHIRYITILFICYNAKFAKGFLQGTPCDGVGKKISNDSCTNCYCEDDRVKCYKAECATLTLPEYPDCKLIYLPGQCCPSYECPSVTSFVSVSSPKDPRCHSKDPCKKCSCVDGLSKCDSYECLEANIPEITKSNCKRVTSKKKCCSDYYCPISENEILSNISHSCLNVKCYMPEIPASCKLYIQPGKCCPQVDCSTTAPIGESFDNGNDHDSQPNSGKCKGKGRIPSNNVCQICFCTNGQKKCNKVKCPDEEVPKGCKKTSVSGECCPRLKCDDESLEDETLEAKRDPNNNSRCIGEGPIPSSNPCSQCTCRKNTIICARISCKQTPRPIGVRCTEESIPGQCCKVTKCSEDID